MPCRRRSPHGRQRALRGSPCRICPAASSRPGGRGHLARSSRAHRARRSNGSGITGQFVPEVPAPRSSLLRSALPAPEPRYCHRSTSSLTYKHLPRRVECQAAEPDDQAVTLSSRRASGPPVRVDMAVNAWRSPMRYEDMTTRRRSVLTKRNLTKIEVSTLMSPRSPEVPQSCSPGHSSERDHARARHHRRLHRDTEHVV